jgi:hypothetical protein
VVGKGMFVCEMYCYKMVTVIYNITTYIDGKIKRYIQKLKIFSIKSKMNE